MPLPLSIGLKAVVVATNVFLGVVFALAALVFIAALLIDKGFATMVFIAALLIGKGFATAVFIATRLTATVFKSTTVVC